MRTLQDNRPVALEMILTGPLRLDR
jgi:hypothetical protein